VILIGAESHPPYERPPLSKDYHRSESSLEQALVQPPGFYGENGIETRFGLRGWTPPRRWSRSMAPCLRASSRGILSGAPAYD
jgi:NADPH-dependent 2,4-dienoyl-CoA reductase/sulfur reductase-like enzyme